jgi:hypothetical protein
MFERDEPRAAVMSRSHEAPHWQVLIDNVGGVEGPTTIRDAIETRS